MKFYVGSKLITSGGRYDISQPIITSGDSSNYRKDTRQLTIHQATLQDSGLYKCQIEDHNGHTNENSLKVEILQLNDSKLTLSTIQKVIKCQERVKCTFIVRYSSYPEANFKIFHNDVQIFSESSKTIIEYKRNESEIVISKLDPGAEDTGNYTVEATNGQITRNTTVQMFIHSTPIVQLDPSHIYVKLGQRGRLSCNVLGYPRSTIEWSFIKCRANEWQFCTKGKAVRNRGIPLTNILYVSQARSTNPNEVNIFYKHFLIPQKIFQCCLWIRNVLSSSSLCINQSLCLC